jgi:hypothetical protein
MLLAGLAGAMPVSGRAQSSPEGVTRAQISAAIHDHSTPIVVSPLAGSRPAILLTGYWPPSNEAVRRFSASPTQNPLGWIGQNWEGRGYDVYAYFPEFSPPTCTSCGPGTGDLQVDYQDTSNDFWPIANALQPIAIITFSRTNASLSWELEMNAYNNQSWTNDYIAPTQPTPAPPDASQPAGFLRTSTLPVQTAVDNVLLSNLGLNAFICFSQSAGAFVSGYMAYHGMWYQSLHASPSDPARCVCAGHVHIGPGVAWPIAQRAAEVTLRTVIHHVDATLDPACQLVDLYCRTSTNSVGAGAMLTTSGSTSIAANNLRFLVTDARPNQSGLLVYGANQIQVTFGAGKRCIGSPIQRLGPIVQTDSAGFVDRPVDLTMSPLSVGPLAVTAGSTWNFQFFYRDPPAGLSTYNATNGASVTFCP